MPSVPGESVFLRQMTLLLEHFPAFAFRGLTRADALRNAGPVPTNDCQHFGVDISWLAAVGRSGELHHIPRELYQKRYHDNNTESKWWSWSREERLRPWACHCVDMLEQTLYIECSVPQRRLIWLAAIDRLTSHQAARFFLPAAELTADERTGLLAMFFERAKESARHDIQVLLDASREEIERWSRGFNWIPDTRPVPVVHFGPNPVRAGELYNVQPDGSSALWVRIGKVVRPDTRIRLGDTVLETYHAGMVLTARVPAELTARAGSLPLVLVGPGGERRSELVTMNVQEPDI